MLRSTLIELTIEAGLTVVGDHFYAFSHEDGSAAGVTGAVLLAESHIAIHTWPERQAVTLDIYVCNFNNDNSKKAREILRKLRELFAPQEVRQQELNRGKAENHTDAAAPASNHIEIKEILTPNTSMHTRSENIIAEERSPLQQIQILETPEFGRVMRIDDAMMTSEKDEHFYHEVLVHPAAVCLNSRKHVLIVGGGDGGSSEEILKYADLEKLTLCEIDPTVIRLAQQHLPRIHRGAFTDPRLEIKSVDGFDFIKHKTAEFDLIMLDLTDPITANGSNLAQSCMSAEFFTHCYRALKSQGAMVLHLGSKFYHPERYHKTVNDLNASFDLVRPYSSFIPLYGALWGMAVALKAQDATTTGESLNVIDPFTKTAADIQVSLHRHNLQDLQYYDGERHTALFRF